MKLHLVGDVSRYARKKAPKEIREAIERARAKDILSDDYPYEKRLGSKDYDDAYHDLQIELVKMQHWARCSGARLVVVFEGRDAAGKGGAIQRLRDNLNPRAARVVALAAPSDVERGQWYFQRYIEHLPTAGEIAFYDRSWYNRAVVERVFGFSTDAERERFFLQAPPFEQGLVQDGIVLIKIWLTVSRAEQLRRFLDRENDPLKQWKLSDIDVKGLSRWDDYTDAISEMFERTNFPMSPWTVIRGDDKRRARLEVMRHVLDQMDYEGKDADRIGKPDPRLVGDPHDMPVRAG